MISKTNPTILTISGQYFPYHAPETYDFDISEIAHSLSKLCRFTGHVDTIGIYSVAQHSVFVSQIVSDELKLSALMHDAAEAYVGDVNAPLKLLLPEYKKIEQAVERAIFKYFSIPMPELEIKKADIRLLAAEKRDFQARSTVRWAVLENVEPYPVEPIWAMTPPNAYIYFMEHWEKYTGTKLQEPE